VIAAFRLKVFQTKRTCNMSLCYLHCAWEGKWQTSHSGFYLAINYNRVCFLSRPLIVTSSSYRLACHSACLRRACETHKEMALVKCLVTESGSKWANRGFILLMSIRAYTHKLAQATLHIFCAPKVYQLEPLLLFTKPQEVRFCMSTGVST